jgi:carbamoyltransferase
MYPAPYDVQDRHDQNSALIVDDKIYAYEEEKLTSVKNESTVRFPERSLMMGMKELNIYPKDVDLWVFPKPLEIDLESMYLFFSWIVKAYLGDKDSFEKWFKKKVKFVPHQIAHASLAVYGSKFDECAFLCLDGGGDLGDPRNFIFGEYSNDKFKVLKNNKGLKNIGVFHSMIADSLGYPNNENGKVSGLSGYGKVQLELRKRFEELIEVKSNGIIFDRKRYGLTSVNLQKIKPKEYNRGKIFNSYPSDTNILRASSSYLPQDTAATGEMVFVNSILSLLKQLKKYTKLKKIVFSG